MIYAVLYLSSSTAVSSDLYVVNACMLLMGCLPLHHREAWFQQRNVRAEPDVDPRWTCWSQKANLLRVKKMKAESRMGRMSAIKGLLERPFPLWYCRRLSTSLTSGNLNRWKLGWLKVLSTESLCRWISVGGCRVRETCGSRSFCGHCVAAAEHASELSETPPGAARGVQPSWVQV